MTGLVDKGWTNTLFFLQNLGQLNAIYAVAAEGSLRDRVERFKKLRADPASEQDKNFFAQGLLVNDDSKQNIIAKTIAAISWNPQAISDMLSALDSIGFFAGALAGTRLHYLLQAFFSSDSMGHSACFFLLNPRYVRHFSFIVDKLFSHAALGRMHKAYFLDALTVKDHLLFFTAAQNLSTYLLVRQLLLKTGCTAVQLAQLLNTAHSETIFQRKIKCTPLMILIFNTIAYSQHNYADFIALMLRFRADGAQLTAKQAQIMRQHLEEIKKIVNSTRSQVALVDACITILQEVVESEPILYSPSAPTFQATSNSGLFSRERRIYKPVDEVFAEDDAEISRVLNSV
ncbi:hypothetical protein [Legionella sp. km772]|uniref:hypothetical protein n=1 Tax=Legionella sp. km772 TaxID=2498111 RepID=UPI000FC2C790|nr:hypothetical protein [Legionella sp. km772]RUR10841.1 hypothetical protein ELY15_07650 [Legionella sp. km772]